MALLRLIKDCLYNNVIVTKRDIYYKDVKLFKTPEKVEWAIAKICRGLKADRHQLNVISSPKGLIYGEIKLFMNSGEIITVAKDKTQGPVMIPTTLCELQFVRLINNLVDTVIIVEKEAVFRELYENLTENVILITGKGYPDIATRRLLNCIQTIYPQVNFYGLVDSDPHGIEILSIYRNGSKRATDNNENLICPALQYLGVSLLDYERGWIDYGPHDYKKALSLLKKERVHCSYYSRELLRELQLGVFIGKKAEMNVLGTETKEKNPLAQYVLNKLFGQIKQTN